MADIFISYASVDRERARELADRLAGRGYQVWWDRTIPPGRVFDEVIQEALHAARCIIVLWSAQSVRSNWVKTEAAEGMSVGRLVPVMIERVLPPIEFKRVQAADLADWSGDEDHSEYRKLLVSVDALLRRPPDAQAGSAPPISLAEQMHRPARRGARYLPFVAGLVLLAAAVGGGYLWGTRGHAPSVAGTAPRNVPSPSQNPSSSASATVPPAAGVAIPTASPASDSGRLNLLAAENGGEIVTASHERWASTIDGRDDTYAWTDAGFAVFGFKDGRAATFDTFSVLIPSTNDNNLGELELLAGNDGPSGNFTSIGTFKTQNIRIMKQPFQEFRFAPVTAKFLKVRSLRASNGTTGAAFAYEFKLMGTLE
jgi:hypothetical protein